MIISTDAQYLSREADGTTRLNATDFNFIKPSRVRDYTGPLPEGWERVRQILKKQS